MEQRPNTPPQAQPQPPVEPRDETIARVEREQGRGVEAENEIDGTDPTSRRQVGRRSLARAGIIGTVIAVPAAIVTVLAGGGMGLALGLAAAVLVGSGVVVALLGAMREDGQIEREVEHVVEERK